MIWWDRFASNSAKIRGKGVFFFAGGVGGSGGLQVSPSPQFFIHRPCNCCSGSKYGLLSADFQVMLTKVNNKLGGEINKMRCPLIINATPAYIPTYSASVQILLRNSGSVEEWVLAICTALYFAKKLISFFWQKLWLFDWLLQKISRLVYTLIILRKSLIHSTFYRRILKIFYTAVLVI